MYKHLKKHELRNLCEELSGSIQTYETEIEYLMEQNKELREENISMRLRMLEADDRTKAKAIEDAHAEVNCEF